MLWALFGAPSAVMPLHGVIRIGFEVVWFGFGVAALAAVGRTAPAVVFAALYVVNAVLARLWHQQS